MKATAGTAGDLVPILQRELARTSPELAPIACISRRPSMYRSSFPLDELDVELSDGTVLPMVLKDASAPLPEARDAKPRFLRESRREVRVYRSGILGSGLAPACHGAVADRAWLFLERVAGTPLSQSGDLDAWREAARALARLHGRFAQGPPHLPELLRRDARFYRRWPRRAVRLLRRGSADARSVFGLLRVAARYDVVVERLLAAPQTFVHGEPYPSNVLLLPGTGRTGVRLVDWEMAGTGPGPLDLAALVSGRWPEADRAEIVAAYTEAAPPRLVAGLPSLLDAGRLHLAMQWLGWSSTWTPPPDQAHDWTAEALDAAERLGL